MRIPAVFLPTFLTSVGLILSSSQALARAQCKAIHIDPLSRPLYERDLSEKEVDLSSVRSILAAQKQAEKMGVMRGEFNAELDTMIYSTRTGKIDPRTGKSPLIDPDSKAVFVFFHGSGTMQSSGANFIANMNTLAAHGFSALSFDMPFHGSGPVRDKFRSADEFMSWTKKIVDMARASNKPVYLVGHSFGPDVIAEYLYRYPHDVQGALLMSPAGFNKTLEDWYNQYTSRMRFGGEVPANRVAGEWSYEVSRQFIWNKNNGSGDPTLINPNLRVKVLSGNREEYVPAPVGGPNRTPIGNNTYDIAAALRPFFRNADIKVEEGIGHYIFDFKDANGNNVVYREIFDLVNVKMEDLKSIAQQLGREREASRSLPEKLGIKYSQDPIFKAWVNQTYTQAAFLRMIRQDNENMAKKMNEDYANWKLVLQERIKQHQD
jgi:pimeloyl-ACP methyl ester carboxylesterase